MAVTPDPSSADLPGVDPMGIEPLESGLHAMRKQPVTVPRQLTGKVAAGLRSSPRPGREIPTGDGASVNETVLATLVRTAADAVNGVRARGCRIRPHRDASGTPVSGPLEVELSFAISYGSGIPAASDALRSTIAATLADRYGLAVGRLRLNAVDLTPSVTP